jgi:opacity protein-like surface antigen
MEVARLFVRAAVLAAGLSTAAAAHAQVQIAVAAGGDGEAGASKHLGVFQGPVLAGGHEAMPAVTAGRRSSRDSRVESQAPAAARARNAFGSAQVRPAPRAPASRVGGAGIVTAGLSFPAAKESFRALGLETRVLEIGGGGRAANLWRGIFVEVVATRWSETGRRVFIDAERRLYDVGIPMRVEVTSVDVGGGWRVVGPAAAKPRRVVPYAGGGVALVFCDERSDFAQPGDDLSQRFVGYHAFGGVEIGLTRWVALGIDVRYRLVPDALGADGVSAVFRETSLGGPSIGIRVLVGPQR